MEVRSEGFVVCGRLGFGGMAAARLFAFAIVLFAMEKQKEIFDKFTAKIELRHGPPTEKHDDEFAVSHVWRFKGNLALEVRSPKDVNSPVVDIHWVKTK